MRRFIQDYQPKFVSKGQEKLECTKPLDFKDWVNLRNNYILPRNEGEFFLIRDQIVVLDGDEISSVLEPKLKFDTMV